jgi:cysteine desulfurase/selenocysteine lyase
LTNIGLDAIHDHELHLTRLALDGLEQMPGIRIIGPTDLKDRGGAVSFVAEGVHPHDLGQVLDDSGVAVRVGHHCAWPLHRRFGIPATSRATFYLYNDDHDVAAFLQATRRAMEYFA